MNHQHYLIAERAIRFIRENFREQPSLKDVAAHVHLNPLHFQKIFTEWCGVSPKKFLQYTNLLLARKLLAQQNATVSETADETGLSGSSRVHDLFVKIEGMSPAQYKSGGRNLEICYSFYPSVFGKLLIASTEIGICLMIFEEDEDAGLQQLRSQFPNALLIRKEDELHHEAQRIFEVDSHDLPKIKLHLKGTPFQLKVWEALLQIPDGRVSTYGDIAAKTSSGKAWRAVGTAIGSNPVAFIIPCHRVIQAAGGIGGYRWGSDRKTAMLGWELSKNQTIDNHE